MVALIVLTSCGPKSAAVLSPSPRASVTPVASPSASPSPINSTIAILYQPIYGASARGAIHEATVENGVVTDRTVVQTTSGTLAASTTGYAVLAVPRPGTATVWNGPQLATVDLNTGALSVYDIGSGTTYCILRSPDPTKLLVCQWDPPNQIFVILDLQSRVIRKVAEISPVTGKPIGWSQEGIFFSAVSGAAELDPQTLAVMQINADGYVGSVSPTGSYLGETKNIYAGDPAGCSDSLFLIHKDWATIASGARHGSESPVISQPKKDFRVLDVADDGSVLYTESDCRNPHQQAAPKSLYYFSGGQSTLQSGLDETAAIYYMAAPQSPGLLLRGTVAVVARRPNGISELDLVHLCTQDGCQPVVTTIARGDASVEAYAFSVLL